MAHLPGARQGHVVEPGLFRCESATLRTHWILVVMDQFTRRIVGFGVHCGVVDGVSLCRMFNRAIRGQTMPKYLSSDHDPLYRFQQWQANLRIEPAPERSRRTTWKEFLTRHWEQILATDFFTV